MNFMDRPSVFIASVYHYGLCSDGVEGMGQNCISNRMEKRGWESVMGEGVALPFQVAMDRAPLLWW